MKGILWRLTAPIWLLSALILMLIVAIGLPFVWIITGDTLKWRKFYFENKFLENWEKKF